MLPKGEGRGEGEPAPPIYYPRSQSEPRRAGWAERAWKVTLSLWQEAAPVDASGDQSVLECAGMTCTLHAFVASQPIMPVAILV